MELQFKEITAEKLGEMMPYYSMRHNRTCDSVFLESFIWKEFYHVRYAIWENKALLWLMESNGEYFSAMPLCREEDLPAAFGAIETYFNEELGCPLMIHLADEYAVKYLNLPADKYLVKEQPDAKDYIYEGNAMRTLAGKKLHKKKNRVNAFKRGYEGRYEYRRLCCSDSHEVWAFLDKWRAQKGEEVEEHLDYEVRGIHDILKNCSELYVRMGGIYIDGQLEAFSIGSYNPVENMAVIHIEKANPEMNGLYQYINQQFLIEEFPEVDWVNREDDLGLEGLRKAKMSYMPADFGRKYLVAQRTDGEKKYDLAEMQGSTGEPGSLTEEEMPDAAMEGGFVYLTNAEKADTIPLWKACFTEDSDGFVKYYYTEKTKDNRILAKRADGKVLSMVHYNPYRIRMQEREMELDYLVAVSTDPEHRRKGYFREMFQKMLKDQTGEGKPITYLVPVNPEVYAPMGFTFIGNIPMYELKLATIQELRREVCRDIPEDCEKAAACMEQWMAARYEMHTRRDAAYVSRLLKELASEGGHMDFLYGKGHMADVEPNRLVGVQAIWGLEQQEQRLLYAEDAYTVKVGEKPWNMARLTNLPALLSAFSLKADAAEEVKAVGWHLLLEVEDPILEENNGTFLWSIEEEMVQGGLTEVCGAAEQQPAEDGKPWSETDGKTGQQDIGQETETEVPRLKTKPAELVSWLFGYRIPEELWPELSGEVKALLEQVDVVKGVFLDEIV